MLTVITVTCRSECGAGAAAALDPGRAATSAAMSSAVPPLARPRGTVIRPRPERGGWMQALTMLLMPPRSCPRAGPQNHNAYGRRDPTLFHRDAHRAELILSC